MKIPGLVCTVAMMPRIRMVSASSLRPGRRLLLVVDGRVCEPGACRPVSPGDITGFQVWTGTLAAVPYGSAGANGVLAFTTRHAVARR